MITTRNFHFQAASTLSPVFSFLGQARSGLLITLENLSEVNQITYKVQTSQDGVSWSDVSFQTQDAQEVVTFTLAVGSAHSWKYVTANPFTRLLASGSANAMASLSYSTENDPEETVTILS